MFTNGKKPASLGSEMIKPRPVEELGLNRLPCIELDQIERILADQFDGSHSSPGMASKIILHGD